MIPHLILHKVRGEAAFDVAHEIENVGWIVSTSGHKAYPIYVWNLDDLADISDINGQGNHNRPANYEYEGPTWDALPDHYTTKPSTEPTVDDLLAKIGFKPAQVELNGVKIRRL